MQHGAGHLGRYAGGGMMLDLAHQRPSYLGRVSVERLFGADPFLLLQSLL